MTNGLLLAALLILYWIKQPAIISDFGVTSLVNQFVTLAIVALAQTLAVMLGGIDLSVGALLSLVTCVAATFAGPSLVGGVAIMLVCLAIGFVAGLLNGALVTYGRIEPLIATLATSFVFAGLALVIRPQPGGSLSPALTNALSGNWGYLPYGLLVILACLGLIWVPIMRSRLGRSVVAIGNSESGAYASGLKVARTKVLTYGFVGLLAAVAGLVVTAQTTSGDASIGDLYTLNSVAAVVLGGVVLKGGRGTAIGPVLAAFVLSVIVSVLVAWGVSALWQSFIQGAVLLLVLLLVGIRVIRNRHWTAFIRGQTI
ncbi:ABC transporter permease [Deinococcus sp. SM5_A1]|uniref:ABC transporter permease n=1 Tax=Deinococcus sp. SM5_A1 TaxID=3379094 RepID=UPI00385AC423